MTRQNKTIAYFSMEFALINEMPNYAGGLGVLAADILYSCADEGVPIVGVTLFYHRSDNPDEAFPIDRYLTDTGKRVTVRIEDRDVVVAIWKMDVYGALGKSVPLLFLTTNVPENKPWDRDILRHLYANDEYTRICQEVVLGVGGVAALDAMGYGEIAHYHMNEGHSAFLTLALWHRFHGDVDAVRARCTFTTHTPVAAGFDRFSVAMVRQILTDFLPKDIAPYISDGRLSMAHMGIALSHSANSVSERHNEVCSTIFPGVVLQNVTNGVYHPRWAGKAIADLYDTYLPQWKQRPEVFMQAPDRIPHEALIAAHRQEKSALCEWVNARREFFAFDDIRDEDYFKEDILTLVFARRYVPYKRHTLIFQDIEKLRALGRGRLQLIFAGRCHPDDRYCNDARVALYDYARQLRGVVNVVVASDYDLDIARQLVAGADIWLNTPVPPREASGTSGMKAALNGVLNLSVADGWWLEGFELSPSAGWSFPGTEAQRNDYLNQHDAYELLLQLEMAMDIYENHPVRWTRRMLSAITLLATFNTNRVVREYQRKLWSYSYKPDNIGPFVP